MARLSLKERRTRLGLTQKDLARRLNVSQQTIARWEGGAEISSKYLKDLAILLGCRVQDLISGDEGDDDSPARRRAARLSEEPDIRYGTARVVWLGSDIDPHEETDEWLPTQYPISEKEMNRLYLRLSRRDDHASWFVFETLDSRLVLVNRQQLEAFTMVSDDVEEMVPFEHEEIYKALSDHNLRDALQGDPRGLKLDEESSPYSAALVGACVEQIERWGGFEQMENRMLGITFETIGGHRENVWASERGFECVAELAFEIDGIEDRDNSPMSEWVVDLFDEGYDRSTLYRLGALRLIEVPLLQYEAANDRIFPA